MANNLTTLAPPEEKWRENSPTVEIPITTNTNNRCIDCFLPIFNSIVSNQNSDIKNNESSLEISSDRKSSSRFIMPTISGSPVCLKDDEDFLFGYTIASMLKTFPRAERNRIKVHIFSFLAVTQNQIGCNEREYFV